MCTSPKKEAPVLFHVPLPVLYLEHIPRKDGTALPIELTSHIRRSDFIRFGIFHRFLAERRYMTFLLLSLTMIGFGIYSLFTSREGYGIFLFLMAVFLPVVSYFGFRFTLKRQAAKMNLSEENPPSYYSATLSEDEILIKNSKESTVLPWDHVRTVYLFPDCLYLYISINKAFVFPFSKTDDALQELLQRKLGRRLKKTVFPSFLPL